MPALVDLNAIPSRLKVLLEANSTIMNLFSGRPLTIKTNWPIQPDGRINPPNYPFLNIFTPEMGIKVLRQVVAASGSKGTTFNPEIHIYMVVSHLNHDDATKERNDLMMNLVNEIQSFTKEDLNNVTFFFKPERTILSLPVNANNSFVSAGELVLLCENKG